MEGPKPKGTWRNPSPTYEIFHRNWTFSVIKEFKDYEGDLHKIGEKWVFLGFHFFGKDAELSLFVSLDGENEWRFKLQNKKNSQGEIFSAFHEYFERIVTAKPSKYYTRALKQEEAARAAAAEAEPAAELKSGPVPKPETDTKPEPVKDPEKKE
ncbi:MAG: DUF3601 domain-containing protein [bacterium]|nr:DUF3601 domain-containing protein [bacterium]